MAVAAWPSAAVSATLPQPQAMLPVAASSVHATAILAARRWGPEINLDCLLSPSRPSRVCRTSSSRCRRASDAMISGCVIIGVLLGMPR
jgi:hypothetical protein